MKDYLAEGDLLAALNQRSPVWARNPIIAGYRGSHAHGTFIPPEDPKGTDDIDVFGLAVCDPNYYLGLDGYHPEKRGTFSTPGETLDIETHELRKFCHLLRKGNPNVHQHLWLRPEHYLVVTRPGRILLDRRDVFMSRTLFMSFVGYARAQFKRMTKFEKRGYMGAKREAIVKAHGYDIKNAAHCLRLLYNAIHLTRYGKIQVRLEGSDLAAVMEVKRGLWSLKAVQNHADYLYNIFEIEKDNSNLPDKVDNDEVNHIVRSVIEAHWEETFL